MAQRAEQAPRQLPRQRPRNNEVSGCHYKAAAGSFASIVRESYLEKRMNPFRWSLSGLTDMLSVRRQARDSSRLRVSNLTRGTELANCMEVADTAAKRSKGLLGREQLSPGEGLWIVPCESVHTFWMRFPIDLVYLDRKKRIRKLRGEVRPWRMSICLTAHSILELPSGTIRLTQTQRGDVIEFSEVPLK
jgi:uncharacterized membrane protein (UPF0127 family)